MARILVIDDDVLMNSMLVQMLKIADYEAKGVSDGKRALKLLDAQSFDLIVTDLIMPKIDGIMMIQVIRAINKTIPIIAVSGGGRSSLSDPLQIAHAEGANYTFEKPIDREAFLEAVKRCLA